MVVLTSEQRKSVERRFHDLSVRWLALARYRSNLRTLRHDPIYQDLIQLGEPAIPLILGELERQPDASWFGLLADLTGEDPVPVEAAGRVAAMVEAWLDWGRCRGYMG